jgi:hypothetical protein
MESNRTLIAPGYLISLILFALPISDTLIQLIPFQFGVERWRFGAAGTMSGMLLLPLVAAGMAMTVATLADHRRFRRILGWLYAAFALVLAAVLVLFILDFFQTRTQVRPQFLSTMTNATIMSIVKQVFTIIALTLLSRAGLSGPKQVTVKTSSTKSKPVTESPLIPLSGSTRAE